MLTVARHNTTGNGTTGANMYGRSHADKETTIAQGILYAPGGGGTETSWQAGTDTQPDISNAVLRGITKDSYALRFLTFHTDWDWGNDTVIARIDDAFTEAQTNCHFAGGSVHLVAASMGCCCVLNWALAHLSSVASISLILPAVDIQDIEDNNRVGVYGLPQPSTAYGGSRPPDSHNPADNAASFSGIPMMMWYSNDDTICVPATVTAFASAVGSSCTAVNLGNRIPFQSGFSIPGHDASNLNPIQVASFITEFDVAGHMRPAPKDYVTTAGRGQ